MKAFGESITVPFVTRAKPCTSQVTDVSGWSVTELREKSRCKQGRDKGPREQRLKLAQLQVAFLLVATGAVAGVAAVFGEIVY